MKVLKGTSVWIKGKLYREGSSIPQQFEKEFEKFLVEKEETKSNPKKDSPKESSKTKSTN
jgi:hypothetical protein